MMKMIAITMIVLIALYGCASQKSGSPGKTAYGPGAAQNNSTTSGSQPAGNATNKTLGTGGSGPVKSGNGSQIVDVGGSIGIGR
ncbi:MAG: hypothetical protein U0R44_02265 [Candidatus Micrarchaeia archaeon]